jgi:hypothetical protein
MYPPFGVGKIINTLIKPYDIPESVIESPRTTVEQGWRVSASAAHAVQVRLIIRTAAAEPIEESSLFKTLESKPDSE